MWLWYYLWSLPSNVQSRTLIWDPHTSNVCTYLTAITWPDKIGEPCEYYHSLISWTYPQGKTAIMTVESLRVARIEYLAAFSVKANTCSLPTLYQKVRFFLINSYVFLSDWWFGRGKLCNFQGYCFISVSKLEPATCRDCPPAPRRARLFCVRKPKSFSDEHGMRVNPRDSSTCRISCLIWQELISFYELRIDVSKRSF